MLDHELCTHEGSVCTSKPEFSPGVSHDDFERKTREPGIGDSGFLIIPRVNPRSRLLGRLGTTSSPILLG